MKKMEYLVHIKKVRVKYSTNPGGDEEREGDKTCGAFNAICMLIGDL
jgi:hypothetical protein